MKMELEFDVRDNQIVNLNREGADFIYENISVKLRGLIKSVTTKLGEDFHIGDSVCYIDYKGNESAPFIIDNFDLDWTRPYMLRAWGDGVAKCYIEDLRSNK